MLIPAALPDFRNSQSEMPHGISHPLSRGITANKPLSYCLGTVTTRGLMKCQCLTFHPLYKERVWGGRVLETHFGRQLPGENPIGESWELVDREDAQSVVRESEFGGASLHDLWVNQRRELFGEDYDFPRFPILVKILDASDVLSVQVHPAPHRLIHEREEPKSEIWYFVTTTEGAGVYAGLKRGVKRTDFEVALSTGRIAELLHHVPTMPDSCIAIPSGRLHAIAAGNAIFEIQQNSDTTYRVFDWNRLGLDGLPRKIHIEESLRHIDFEDFEPELNRCETEKLVDWPHFNVDRWALNSSRRANETRKFSVFQVARGNVSFGDRIFNQGDLFLVPASSHQGQVAPIGEPAIVLRTTL
jgi:mannose-6-phosphate isomerase